MKDETLLFLQCGGVLLRADINKKKEPVLQRKTLNQDWHTHVVCGNMEIVNGLINKLTTHHPDKFKLYKDDNN